MYHPDTFLMIGHNREADLIAEARACGIGQAETPRQHGWTAIAMLVLCGTIAIALARLLLA